MSNRANLGIEIMHKRNAYNFSLDLVAGETVPVARMSTTGYAYAPVIHALYLEGAFLMKL
ncbi:hypothetical protein [Nostoc sp.]|uniref:hypothetical protein n=1 Tax=Nostoc sp. TaxID=1180 RepID=UPI002FFCFF67